MSKLPGRLLPVLAVAILVLLGWWFMPHDRTGAEPPVGQAKQRDQFAADRDPPPAPVAVPFDGQRALGYIKELCRIGPRISGSDGMRRQQELIKAHFEKHGAKVEFQRFQGRQASQPRPVELANIIISWHPDRTRRVLLCSHYDTRPRADQERDQGRWDQPFVSANDGTSGVAFFMELAHHMKKLPSAVGVDFVLFDGEEYVFDGPEGRDRYFFGSEHFAAEYQRRPPAHRYAGAVLLDLFAGKDAKFPIEQNSWFQAPVLTQEVWKIAADLRVEAFQNRLGPTVNDDHLALNRAGIPAVDVIDFDYPHWHKLSDQPDQCSAETMQGVAKVLTAWVQRAR